jgi:hypothetical protein
MMDLATQLEFAADPSLLMVEAGITPDDWQARALRSQAKRALWCCARQTGKTETASFVAIRDAILTPESLVIIISIAEDQAREFFRRTVVSYDRLGRPVDVVRQLTQGLELANGSRILALANNPATVRGYPSVRRVIVDEAAQVDDKMFTTVMPMLAVSQGSILCLSSPFGQRGWFFDRYGDDDQDWERVRVLATECPRISKEFLEKERRSMTPDAFAQEYEAVFTSAEGQLFSDEMIQSIFTNDEDAAILTGF